MEVQFEDLDLNEDFEDVIFPHCNFLNFKLTFFWSEHDLNLEVIQNYQFLPLGWESIPLTNGYEVQPRFESSLAYASHFVVFGL